MTGRTEGGRVRLVAGHSGPLVMGRSLDYSLIALGSPLILTPLLCPLHEGKILRKKKRSLRNESWNTDL